ncbi:MAG: MFS transporter [Burkholderiales bacterium]
MAIALTLWLDFFNFVAAGAARVLLTLFALHMGASATEVGLLGGLLFLFPLLLSWPVGAMVDRLGSRGLLVFASVCGTVSLVLPYFFHTLPALYVAAALTGLAQAFFHVTLQNNIGSLSTPENRARNFSNFSLIGALTSFVGPLVAGFSIDHWGYGVACLVAASFSVMAIVLLVVWGGVFPRGKLPTPRNKATEGALLDRKVWRMLILSALVQLGYDLYQFYVPVYAHAIGLSASAIGAVLATLAIAAFIVRLYLPRLVKQVAGDTLLGWVFLSGAIGFALVPFSGNGLMLGIISFIFGLGMGIGIPLTVILMYANSPEGRSGQTLGLRLTGNNLVRVVGPAIFGTVGTALGLSAVFWIIAAIMVAGGVTSRIPPAKKLP